MPTAYWPECGSKIRRERRSTDLIRVFLLFGLRAVKCLNGVFRDPCTCPLLEVKKIVLKFNVTKVMLNFEHL